MRSLQSADWVDLLRAGQIEGPEGPLHVVREHETHTAWVFLTATHAFKLRKPVNLGFLDYSTPAKRRIAACTEETIGRRISPQVYLGVWSLSVSLRPSLGAAGTDGEPVVAMMRLPDAAQMETLFSNPLTPLALIGEIAQACARFHAACPIDRRPDGYGALEKTFAAWAINFEQLPHAESSIPLSPAERDLLTAQTTEWFETLRPTLLQRIAEGRVREGHGDLRLSHVYLTRPWSVIDPLEFSVELRFCDVAAEVCFLAMELDDLGRSDVAEHLLLTYAETTEDRSLLIVAPFFKRYRAVVRAKVEWIRSRQTSGAKQAATLAASRRLFELALSYEA